MQHFFKKNRIGNCHECSYIGLENLINQGITAQIREFINGDHVYLAVGKEKKDMAIADVFAGEVFPGFAFESKIKTYWHYAHLDYKTKIVSHYNIITSYNPEYHQIQTLFSYKPPKMCHPDPCESRGKDLLKIHSLQFQEILPPAFAGVRMTHSISQMSKSPSITFLK